MLFMYSFIFFLPEDVFRKEKEHGVLTSFLVPSLQSAKVITHGHTL